MSIVRKREVTLEKMEELFNFLKGDGMPDGVTMAAIPDLDPQTAFGVIWFLQEHMNVLPDNFEICQECHRLIDTNWEGVRSERKGWFCDDDAPVAETK